MLELVSWDGDPRRLRVVLDPSNDRRRSAVFEATTEEQRRRYLASLRGDFEMWLCLVVRSAAPDRARRVLELSLRYKGIVAEASRAQASSARRRRWSIRWRPRAARSSSSSRI